MSENWKLIEIINNKPLAKTYRVLSLSLCLSLCLSLSLSLKVTQTVIIAKKTTVLSCIKRVHTVDSRYLKKLINQTTDFERNLKRYCALK